MALVGLILCDEMSEVCDDYSVEPFQLAIGLGVMGGLGEVHISQTHSQGCKEL